MRRIYLSALLMVLFASQSFAQTQRTLPGKLELFGGYLDSGEFPYTDLKFTGFSALPADFGTHRGVEVSVIRDISRHFGVKGDFSANFQSHGFPLNVCLQNPCSPVAQSGELIPRLFNILAGPEIKLGNRKWRTAPFTHALFGVAHATATVRTSGSALNLSESLSETGLAMAFGGGVDVRLSRRFSARTSLDFNPKWVGRDDNGARQVQNDLRLAIGVLFH